MKQFVPMRDDRNDGFGDSREMDEFNAFASRNNFDQMDSDFFDHDGLS